MSCLFEMGKPLKPSKQVDENNVFTVFLSLVK